MAYAGKIIYYAICQINNILYEKKKQLQFHAIMADFFLPYKKKAVLVRAVVKLISPGSILAGHKILRDAQVVQHNLPPLDYSS